MQLAKRKINFQNIQKHCFHNTSHGMKLAICHPKSQRLQSELMRKEQASTSLSSLDTPGAARQLAV